MPANEIRLPRHAWRQWPFWLLVYLPLSLMLNEVHYRTVDKPNYARQLQLHQEIVSSRTERPYNIRVLQPLAVQALIDWLPGKEQGKFLGGYTVFRILSFLVTFCLAEQVFAAFGSLAVARLCVLLLAAAHPFTFLVYYFQPSSVLDLACFTLGMWLILAGRHWPLIPLVILATANRNTSAFICLAYGLYHLDAFWTPDRAARRRYVAVCLLLGLSWALEIGLLEWYFPTDRWCEGSRIGFVANLSDNKVWNYFLMMCAPLVAGVCLGWRASTSAMRRMVIWAVVYLAVHLGMARAYEARYWLNLYVGLGPFCVWAYERFGRQGEGDAT